MLRRGEHSAGIARARRGRNLAMRVIVVKEGGKGDGRARLMIRGKLELEKVASYSKRVEPSFPFYKGRAF